MFFAKVFHLGLMTLIAVSGFAENKSPTVVIIGAGLAGLTTAYRLQQKGIDVQVYEAKGRVGGRIFTVKLADQIGELGAQNITDGGEAENMRRLIGELGLELIESRVLLNHSYFDGKTLIPNPSFTEGFDPIALQSQLADLSKKSKNMRDVLDALLQEEDPLYQTLSVRLAAYEGASVEKLSPLCVHTLYYMLLGGVCSVHQKKEIELASIQGGNALLPEALANSLQGKVHLNMPLIAVSKAVEDSYELTFQNGQKARADILVLAIPCPTYEDIAFQKNVIPEKKLQSIQQIPYGTTAKILFPCSQPPLKRMALINNRAISFFDVNENVLILYYTGEAGHFSPQTIEQTYNQERPMLKAGLQELFLPLSTPVFAQDEPLISYEGAVGYSWTHDPYIKGSYSYMAAGQEALLTDISKEGEELVKTLFAPIDETLYFAGEHTTLRLEIIGTMEAACESGERTARLINKSLKIP